MDVDVEVFWVLENLLDDARADRGGEFSVFCFTEAVGSLTILRPGKVRNNWSICSCHTAVDVSGPTVAGGQFEFGNLADQ